MTINYGSYVLRSTRFEHNNLHLSMGGIYLHVYLFIWTYFAINDQIEAHYKLSKYHKEELQRLQ